MDIVAELTPSAPLLAVQHAARTLRIGGWTRLTGVGVATDVVAAEPMMADGDVLFLVACRAAACTGDDRAAVGQPWPRRECGLHLPVAAVAQHCHAGRMATLADPTAPADVALDMLSLATVTERLDAWAAVELCKLSGLLPAAVLVPGEKIEAKVATVSLAAVSAYRRLSAATLRPVSEARVPWPMPRTCASSRLGP